MFFKLSSNKRNKFLFKRFLKGEALTFLLSRGFSRLLLSPINFVISKTFIKTIIPSSSFCFFRNYEVYFSTEFNDLSYWKMLLVITYRLRNLLRMRWVTNTVFKNLWVISVNNIMLKRSWEIFGHSFLKNGI